MQQQEQLQTQQDLGKEAEEKVPSKKEQLKEELKGKSYEEQKGAVAPGGDVSQAPEGEPQTYVDVLGNTIKVDVVTSTMKVGEVEHKVRTYYHKDDAGQVVRITRITDWVEGRTTHSRYEMMDKAGKVENVVESTKDRPRTEEEQQLYDILNPEEVEKRELEKRQVNFEAELEKQYKRQFGSKFGGKLYKLLTDAIGPNKLLGYAKDGIEAGLKSLADLADPAQGGEQLKAQWGKLSKEAAAALANTPEAMQLTQWVSNFTREHPYGLMLTALITAVLAGYKFYSDNMDIPELEKMFKVNDNLKLGGKIDLGKIQEITLDSLHGYMDVHVGAFSMNLDVGHDKVGEGDEEHGEFTVDAKSKLQILDKTEKDIDETTKILEREKATKLQATFGGTFKYNEAEWDLETMDIALGIALEARDKRLVSVEKLDRLQRCEYKETVFKLYANHMQKFKNIEGQLSPGEMNLSMGLSLVMNKKVEITTTELDGSTKKYNLNPMSYGFNWDMKYSDNPLDLDGGPKVGTELGAFVKKGNWTLGASVDYTRDLMKNQNNFGGKISLSFSF